MMKVKSFSKQASKQVNVIGCMDNTMDNTFESANRVYGQDGCSPTINTCGGGDRQPKILEVKKMNAQSLRMVRTDEGKALRKAYESGEIHHGFNEHRTAEPRTDGVSNTITTVQKDNLICEQKLIPCSIDKVSDGEFTSCDDIRIKDIDKKCANAITSRYYKGIDSHNANAVICCAMRGRNPDNPSDRSAGIPTEQRLELQEDNICNCLTSVQKDSLVLEIKSRIDEKYHPFIYEIDGEYYLIRIRKLTPIETWRLMDFSDEDFEKAQAVNSNTQLYKQSGNSIVKAVLMAIFKQLIESED